MSLSVSFIPRLAALERRREPANHQSSACVSRRSRTGLLPLLELFLRQWLEERFVDIDRSAQRAEAALRLGSDRHQPGDRHLAARNDDGRTFLDAREKLRQLGLGDMNSYGFFRRMALLAKS